MNIKFINEEIDLYTVVNANSWQTDRVRNIALWLHFLKSLVFSNVLSVLILTTWPQDRSADSRDGSSGGILCPCYEIWVCKKLIIFLFNIRKYTRTSKWLRLVVFSPVYLGGNFVETYRVLRTKDKVHDTRVNLGNKPTDFTDWSFMRQTQNDTRNCDWFAKIWNTNFAHVDGSGPYRPALNQLKWLQQRCNWGKQEKHSLVCILLRFSLPLYKAT